MTDIITKGLTTEDVVKMNKKYLEDFESADILNLYPDSRGHIAKIRGYKSFRGMVYQFKRINKQCIKNNWSADFTIRLPIKWK